MSEPACSRCEAGKEAAWRPNSLFWLFLLFAAVFILSPSLNWLSPLAAALAAYLKKIAVPMLIGLLLGGVINWLIPAEYISKLLAERRKRTIIFAVITGFFMSACSHGILALAIQLYKKGASPPAVVAFLLASPWANFPLTILMYGFFGIKAFLLIGGAVVIALAAGYIFLLLEKYSLIEHNPNTIKLAENYSLIKDIQQRLGKINFTFSEVASAFKAIASGALALANMVLGWVLLGVFISSLAAAYLPPHFMHQYMGPGLSGLLVTLFMATIIEICSEGSAPLAFEIFRQTGALGNSFTFLLAGVATDYTEIGLLWTNVGWRTAVWLPVVTVPMVLILALLLNLR